MRSRVFCPYSSSTLSVALERSAADFEKEKTTFKSVTQTKKRKRRLLNGSVARKCFIEHVKIEFSGKFYTRLSNAASDTIYL